VRGGRRSVNSFRDCALGLYGQRSMPNTTSYRIDEMNHVNIRELGRTLNGYFCEMLDITCTLQLNSAVLPRHRAHVIRKSPTGKVSVNNSNLPLRVSRSDMFVLDNEGAIHLDRPQDVRDETVRHVH
jgi:hypothetical protein